MSIIYIKYVKEYFMYVILVSLQNKIHPYDVPQVRKKLETYVQYNVSF